MNKPDLLPADIAACVDMLVDDAARDHLRAGVQSETILTVADVWIDGRPAGDYEIVIRPKASALGLRLASLDNPWMRSFD